jgi:hypothetical protein
MLHAGATRRQRMVGRGLAFARRRDRSRSVSSPSAARTGARGEDRSARRRDVLHLDVPTLAELREFQRVRAEPCVSIYLPTGP